MLNLTLRQLTIFNAVAQHLSFSRAAKQLHLTQPAVSMQIKQLEITLGTPLFEQSGKKNRLSAAGRELQFYGRTIVQHLTEMESVLNEMKEVGTGRLSISVASTASYFMPQLLAQFTRRYPKIRVNLNVTNRETVIAHLMNHDMDLAVMGRPPAAIALSATPFLDNPLVIIAPPQHPLTQHPSVTAKQLRDQVFILREPGSGTRQAMETFFAGHRIPISTAIEMNTNEAIKNAVQAGMGLGVVSQHCIALELAAHTLVQLPTSGFPIQRHWYVMHQANKRLSATAQAFKTFLIEESKNIINRP